MVIETKEMRKIEYPAQGKLTKRVQRLKDTLLKGPPRLDCERLKVQKEVYEEMDGEPTILKRARLFERLCDEKDIYIDESLLVGAQTRIPGGLYGYPEITCRWIRKERDFFCHLGKIEYSEEDRKILEVTRIY